MLKMSRAAMLEVASILAEERNRSVSVAFNRGAGVPPISSINAHHNRVAVALAERMGLSPGTPIRAAFLLSAEAEEAS